jgi:hypothetical protein
MTIAVADYAELYEREFRPQHALKRRLRRALALTLWAGLFLVRPRLALRIWGER